MDNSIVKVSYPTNGHALTRNLLRRSQATKATTLSLALAHGAGVGFKPVLFSCF